MEKKLKKITISIEKTLYEKIEEKAKKDGRSISEFIRRVIESEGITDDK